MGHSSWWSPRALLCSPSLRQGAGDRVVRFGGGGSAGAAGAAGGGAPLLLHLLLPPRVRPSAQLSSSNSRRAASSRPAQRETITTPPCLPPLGFFPPAAHNLQHPNTHLIRAPGRLSTGSDTGTQTPHHTAHKHTPLRAVFLPPPALRGFKGPICRLT